MALISIILLFFPPIQDSLQVEVYQVERAGFIEIWARNPHIFPVTIEISAELDNLSSDKSIPMTDVLEPESDRKLIRLDPINERRAWNFETTFATYPGDIFAKHQDDYEYQFPFRRGSTHYISQAYHGDFSHYGNSAYAIDFTMPEGTQIYAARDGIVIEVEQRFDEGGESKYYLEKANYVTILHSDGTMADYSHLQYNGARVSVGQKVNVGEFLGFSGSTGFVTGPHLHFSVKKTVIGGKYETLPVQFATQNGPVTPQEGRSYTAF